MSKTVIVILLIWLLFASFNFEFLVLDENQIIDIGLDTSVFFPLSVFELEFHASGLKYALLFTIGLWLSIKYASHLKLIHIWLLGLFFMVTGNLIQGGIAQGFYDPFVEGQIQYFHDAKKIENGLQWLADFTQVQDTLLVHTKSHPPFAVLLHHFILNVGNERLEILASSFVMLASISVVLIWLIFKAIGLEIQQRNLLSLLFIVIPAVNIYSCISLDAIILVTSLIFLLGLIQIYRNGLRWDGVILFLSGVLLTNGLTFGGIFFILLVFTLGMREILINRKPTFIFLLGIILAVGFILNELFGKFFGYSHFLAFLNASQIENPEGFRAFSEPVNYLLTRIENVGDIALFLSMGCLILFFHPNNLNVRLRNVKNDWNAIFLSGCFALVLMFLSGAFRTGETARACLFIYPFIFLVFRNLDAPMMEKLIYFAGAQTIIMQLFGNYFW